MHALYLPILKKEYVPASELYLLNNHKHVLINILNTCFM